MRQKVINSRLPLFFKPLFWSYKFSSIDPKEDKKRIIINTINYGQWRHWAWIMEFYGKKEVKRAIEQAAKTEFRPQALKLASVLLGIKELKYASRSAYIKSQKNL